METSATNGVSSSKKHVLIIGAGVGGSCLAARLAARGHKVTVLEKHDQPGGRCSLLRTKDHRWDVGPSLYLMPELFEAFFKSVNRDINDYVQLDRCEPTYNVFFSPNEKGKPSDPPLQLSTSLPSLGAQLERYERPAGNPDPLGSFLGFIKESGDHYEASVKHVLLRDWNDLFTAITQWDVYPMLLRTQILRIWTTVWARSAHFFYSDQIRRAMSFSCMYMGMSPFDAPASYSLLSYAEYAKAVWYPKGGFQTVPAAYEKIAKEYGATFQYNTTVSKILAEEGGKTDSVQGVELKDGTKIYADVVVSNADLVWTYNHLLPPSNYAKYLQTKELTCSSISFYWGLSEEVKELGIHNIFLAEQYRESFDEIFKDGKVPSEPSFYINVPSRIDKTAAPNGGDTVVVLVPCGPIAGDKAPDGYKDKASFEKIKAHVRKQILETVQARTGRNLEPLIKEEFVKDPWDWREQFGLWNGSILGLSHSVSQVLWFRPGNEHAKYKNMFFVGASAMPGTGVPVVTAGSGIVADRVEAYLQGKRRRSNIVPLLVIAALFIAVFVAIFGLF
eukprot:TRINITY_DN25822_c0_g1_i1.p1 TRINITY_DN25822_c0_g1~~TRINITY_DN25822_c0_g1_i1.p1  ORF type:complete len:560 (-),score=106.15 TRINITY_DN25822_c0_g1_i1:8-1687(-)